jgi:hypothetical protein
LEGFPEKVPTILVFEFLEHPAQWISSYLLSMVNCHLGDESVFYLDCRHQRKGTAMIRPPINRPSATHNLTCEQVHHFVGDKHISPIAFDAVNDIEEGIVRDPYPR